MKARTASFTLSHAMNSFLLCLARFGRWLDHSSTQKVEKRRHGINVERALIKARKEHSAVRNDKPYGLSR